MGYLSSGLQIQLFRWFLVLLFAVAWVAVAPAQTIVRVEEDWEMVVGEPDPTADAPQVTCVISPQGNVDGIYATFELNNRTTPDFAAGGLQFEIWQDEVALHERKFPNQSALTTQGEAVSWTQSMALEEGNLVFEITNGSSTTWGSFGGQGYLTFSMCTSMASLNTYNPDVSVANSGVSYAANRVQSLTLKRIRLYTSDGTEVELATPRVVHSLD